MAEMTLTYRLWLVKELANRTRKNPAYSLRAFSKSLGISAPSLSQIMSGKRPMSQKTALKIVQRSAMSPDETQAFLSSALGREWNEALNQSDPLFAPSELQELEIETFRAISDWYHYAILSLGDVRPNSHRPEWIAAQLGISRRDARSAFERLEKLGMVARRGRGFYQSRPPHSVPTRGFETAMRSHHAQNLRKAEEALAAPEARLEHFSSITMAVDEANLPKVRDLIKRFRRNLCRFLENGTRDRVYTLTVQLFPVSKGLSRNQLRKRGRDEMARIEDAAASSAQRRTRCGTSERGRGPRTKSLAIPADRVGVYFGTGPEGRKDGDLL